MAELRVLGDPEPAPSATPLRQPSQLRVLGDPGSSKIPSGSVEDTGLWGSFLQEHLPEGIYSLLPSGLTGPSVGSQLADVHQRTIAKEAELGRPLTLKERLDIEPVMQSPIASGFTTSQLGEQLPTGMLRSPASAQKAIDKTYQRVVKPLGRQRETGPAEQRYLDQAKDAMSSIVGNKANLRLTDANGNDIVGQLPRSLEQFRDAIDQTKGEMYRQYDALKQQTEQAGAQVLLAPVINELRTIANAKEIIDVHPELASYASNLVDRFSRRFTYTMTEAQNVVQNLNQSLKNFYKNPTMETTGRANVDAMVANKLRESLDLIITNETSPGYQQLRNKYAALKTIEADVTKQTRQVARRELGGGILGRIADVASASEVIHGLATLNPVSFATGVATKTWAEWVKFQRDPNRAIAQIFDMAEQLHSPMPPKPPVIPPAIRGVPVPLTPGLGVGGGNDDPAYQTILGLL